MWAATGGGEKALNIIFIGPCFYDFVIRLRITRVLLFVSANFDMSNISLKIKAGSIHELLRLALTMTIRRSIELELPDEVLTASGY